MTHRVLILAGSTSLLCVQLLLSGCGSALTPLVQIETREVKVPVRTPLPAECFEDYKVPALSQAGTLTFREFEQWTDGLVGVIESYRVQNSHCRELNGRDPPAPP